MKERHEINDFMGFDKNNTAIKFEELVKRCEKEHLDLLERSKTESISLVEIMRPVQLIYNLSMNKYWETMDKINKTT